MISKKRILEIIILLVVFLPTGKWLYITQLLCTVILFFIGYNKIRLNKYIFQYKLLITASILFTLVYSFALSHPIYLDSTLKIFNILLLIVFYPLINGYTISEKLIIYTVAVVLASQLVFIFNVTPVVEFIKNYYTTEGFKNWGERVLTENISGNWSVFDMRFGGIFRNPNQCGRMLTLLLVVYLQLKKTLNFKDILVLILFFTSLLLTGSRTSMLIFVFIVLYFVFRNVKVKKSYVYSLSVVVAIALGILSIKYNSRILSVFSFSGDQPASVSIKYLFLFFYIKETILNNFFDLLFGKFNIDDLKLIFENLAITKFDAELGYLIHAIGVFGVVALILFFAQIFRMADKKFYLFYILLLWSLTSTILTNLRFSFLFFLFFSNFLYLKQVNESKNENS